MKFYVSIRIRGKTQVFELLNTKQAFAFLKATVALEKTIDSAKKRKGLPRGKRPTRLG